ncbi:hypothetical protein A5881_003942 [Enterococcus termitis]|nr:hypothetical protein A5881_003834 [Enterococcus termitis]
MKKNLIVSGLIIFVLCFFYKSSIEIERPQYSNYKIAIFLETSSNTSKEDYLKKLSSEAKVENVDLIKVETTYRENGIKRVYYPLNKSNFKIPVSVLKLKNEVESFDKVKEIRGTYLVSEKLNLDKMSELGLHVVYEEQVIVSQLKYFFSEEIYLYTSIAVIISIIIVATLAAMFKSRTYRLLEIDGLSYFSIGKYEFLDTSVFFIKYFSTLICTSIIIQFIFLNGIDLIFSKLTFIAAIVLYGFYVLIYWLSLYMYKIGPESKSAKISCFYSISYVFRIGILIIMLLTVSTILQKLEEYKKLDTQIDWEQVTDYNLMDISSMIPQDDIGYNSVAERIKAVLSQEDNIILSAYNKGYNYGNTDVNPETGNSMIINKNYLKFSNIKDQFEERISSDQINFESLDCVLIIPKMYASHIEKIKEDYKQWYQFLTNTNIEVRMKIIYELDNQTTNAYSFDENVDELFQKNAIHFVIDEKKLSQDIYLSFLSSRFFLVASSKELDSSLKENNLDKYFFTISKIGNLIQLELAKKMMIITYTIIISFLLLLLSISLDIIDLLLYHMYKKKSIFLLRVDGFTIWKRYEPLISGFVVCDLIFLISSIWLLTPSISLITILLIIIMVKYGMMLIQLLCNSRKEADRNV